ncbi:conjugal transfer protein TrbF [Pseudomonas sp. BAY1663]|nr:conjugal transfer protein TrbF [Pseudomonas sp. BAY1663]
MRFKRPQVRYADTPQPATPYQSAAQVWDERIGSARVQAKNWRLMAFGCLVLALLMAGGLVWRSAQSIVTPYVVEVDNAGQVRAVGEAATPYRPNDAQTAHHIARFITLVRSLSIDPSWCGRTGSTPTTTPRTRAQPCSTTTPAAITRSPVLAANR